MFFGVWIFLAASGVAHSRELTVLLDRPAATLDPRMALDATGQRLGELLFRALTRIDKNLDPQPDLAERWEILDGGKTWRFPFKKGQLDHSGKAITPERMAACLENYRTGKPASLLIGSFSSWKSTEARNGAIYLRLTHPDPYLARNVSLLRYFTSDDPGASPCGAPKQGHAVIGSGLYKTAAPLLDLAPNYELELVPASAAAASPLRFLFVMNENTRSLKIVRGEVDAAHNSLALAKTRWIQTKYADRFRVLEKDNVAVSYLAFNLRNPILRDVRVRRAIALAIDRQDYVTNKLFGFGTIAGSLLFPTLPESYSVPFDHDLKRAEKLLDEAGYPRGSDGVRLTLRYKTTPIRDGFEMARVFQSMLKRVGISLMIDTVEPAVFLSSFRKGAFQICSSRWIGISDGSIFYRILRSGRPDNRVGYVNPDVDQWLDDAAKETRIEKRALLLKKVQAQMTKDLPYFPLWYWKGALILKKGVTGVEADDLSLSGSLVPLAHLR